MASRRSQENGTESALFGEHPLFPLEEGQRAFEVTFITLARKEGAAIYYIPQLFKAEDLTSELDILERFGGGTYELIARSMSRTDPERAGHITKRRVIQLPGRPKLLDPSNPTPAEEIAAGLRERPGQERTVAPPQNPLGGDSVLVAILQMNAQAAERSQQQSKEFMMLFMNMIEQGRKESSQNNQAMIQMMSTMSQSSQQSMMSLIPLLVGQKGGGAEEIAKYVELFKQLGFQAPGSGGEKETPENESIGSILENVADIVTGAPSALAVLKNVIPSMGPGPQAPAMTEAPPGSAASVLKGRS